MAHQVDLDEARTVLGPLGPGANGNLTLQEGPGLGVRAALRPQADPLILQVAVNGRGTHGSGRRRVGVAQVQVPVALQHRHEYRQHRCQMLARRVATERPDERQGDRALSRVARSAGLAGSHQLDRAGRLDGVARVIAGPAGQFHQAIEDQRLFGFQSPFIGSGHLLGDRVALTHR